jgi:hypothetical protein
MLPGGREPVPVAGAAAAAGDGRRGPLPGPAELRELPAELGKVDAVLDDDRFLAPFRARLTASIGRPTIPIETYLRLMYLKHRYGLGYETSSAGAAQRCAPPRSHAPACRPSGDDRAAAFSAQDRPP